MLLDHIIQPNQEFEHCSERSTHCEKTKHCRYQSEEFNNVLSFREFPIDQNYFV